MGVEQALLEVAELKRAALAQEDFTRASEIKAVETKLLALEAQDQDFSRLKAEALWMEDYAAAGIIKAQHDGLQRQAEAELHKLKNPVSVATPSQPAIDAPANAGTAAAAAAAKKAAAPGEGKAGKAGKGGKPTGEKKTAKGSGTAALMAANGPKKQQGAGKPGGKATTGKAAAAAAGSSSAADSAAAEMAIAQAAALERVHKAVAARTASATAIAAVFRGHSKRARDEAATTLQRTLAELYAARGKWTKFKLCMRRLRLAATAIQAYVRRHQAAMRLHRVLNARRRQSEAAVAQHQEQSAAAVRLQAHTRGKAVRREHGDVHAEVKERQEAADVIRRFFVALSNGQEMLERVSVIGGTLAKASATLQAAAKGKLDRKRVAQMQVAAKSIGGCARRHYNRNHGVQEHAANVLVDFLRATEEHGSLIGRMRKIIDDARMNAARMQAAVRGAAARRRSVAVRQQAFEEKLRAATPKLQAGLRGMAARRQSVTLRREHAQAAAVQKVQAGIRGRAARRKHVMVRQHIEDTNASLKLQAAMRGRLARRRSKAEREYGLQASCAERLQANLRGVITRRRLARAAAEARVTPPIDIVLRLRCAPMARDADALARVLARCLREHTTPTMRLRPTRLSIRPAGGIGALGLGPGAGMSADGPGAGVGTEGGRSGAGVGAGFPMSPSVGVRPDGTEESIVLVARVLPGLVPGEVSAFDAAAALTRIPLTSLGVAMGATLAAPLTATLVVPAVPSGPSGTASDIPPPLAAGEEEWRAKEVGSATEHLVIASEVGRAASEEARAHAVTTLLHYVRSLERTPPMPPDGASMDASLVAPPPEAVVPRTALIASLGVLLPLIREALHAARLSSPGGARGEHGNLGGDGGFHGGSGDSAWLGAMGRADEGGSGFGGGGGDGEGSGGAGGGAGDFYGVEAAPIRSFVALQRPSPFEAAPRGPAVAGRRLRWVSHRVELTCPPMPSTSYDLDGVIEDGASGAVAAYTTLCQPMVRAALRGVSGCLIAHGDASASASAALFGELAYANRLDGALAWASGARQGASAGSRRCGLSGLVMAEILAEPERWLSGADEEVARRGAPWQVQCSAFEVTASGVVDLLQPAEAPSSGRRGPSPQVTTVPLREWPDGGAGGTSYAWPDELARVSVQSPFDFGELLASALSRRHTLAPQSSVSLPSGTAHAARTSPAGSPMLPQPPLCVPMALVIEVRGTTAEGDATSAQMVLWDLPGPVAPPSPPSAVGRVGGVGYAAIGSDERAALTASLRAASSEARALSQGLRGVRQTVDLLGTATATGGRESVAHALGEASRHTLTRLLWRALAGDVLTTCVCLASASEWHLPAAVEVIELASAARRLRTRPRPRRVRPAPTLDELSEWLENADEEGSRAATDVATEAALQAALAPEDWFDLPRRMGYDQLLRELEQLTTLGAGPELEGSVLRKLTRRLLADVRTLRKDGGSNSAKGGHAKGGGAKGGSDNAKGCGVQDQASSSSASRGDDRSGKGAATTASTSTVSFASPEGGFATPRRASKLPQPAPSVEDIDAERTRAEARAAAAEAELNRLRRRMGSAEVELSAAAAREAELLKRHEELEARLHDPLPVDQGAVCTGADVAAAGARAVPASSPLAVSCASPSNGCYASPPPSVGSAACASGFSTVGSPMAQAHATLPKSGSSAAGSCACSPSSVTRPSRSEVAARQDRMLQELVEAQLLGPAQAAAAAGTGQRSQVHGGRAAAADPRHR